MVLIDFSTSIAQDPERGDLGKKEENAGVLSNTINIDLLNKDTQEIEKYPLMEKGIQLPAEGKFTFHTNEFNKKNLLIKLYENYTLIKTIDIKLDYELPVGTPVLFELFISKEVVITAKGQVANKTFSAVIEPPKVVAPEPEYYEKLKKEFDETVIYAKPGDQVRFNAQKRNICINIDEGYRDDEKQRIIEYVDKLRELIADVKKSLPKPIEPKSDVLFDLADEVDEGIDKAKSQGKSCNLTHQNVQMVRDDANKAYAANDQTRVTECYKKLQNMHRYVEDIVGPPPPPPLDPWQRALGLCMYAILPKLNELLEDPKLTFEYRQKVNQMLNEVNGYILRCSPTMSDVEANEIITACQRMYVEIQKIYAAINKPMPKDDEGKNLFSK
jgi:hypothetical protein